MLYALGDPVSLVLLLVGFVLAATVHGWVQCRAALRTGDRQVVAEGRTRPDPRRHVDPFGAVSAAIVGIGWAKPVPAPDRRDRRAVLTVLLSGAAANLVLGLLLLVGFRLAGGAVTGAGALALKYGLGGTDLLLRTLLLLGLANVFTAGLSLVPLPPLDGGRLLFALAPQSLSWRKAQHQLDERNIGIAVLLALLLLPLGGPQPLLPLLLDTVLLPLVNLVTGG